MKTYLNSLKTEFCRYYKLTSEHVEEIYRRAKEQEQDELRIYWRAFEALKQETRHK